MIRYCKTCVYPETKPDLFFNDQGVCSACYNFKNRENIDYEKRQKEFHSVLEKYRSADGENYDCVIPVSGGKDSHYQVIKILETGLIPLCVTATTDSLTEIGRHNIENLKRLGVDYIEVSTNPVLRRRLNKLALEKIGDISWPEHVTIFTIPVRIAVQMNIPLIIWGENPQDEYGGPAASSEKNNLDRRWLEEFGGLLGLRVSDLIGQGGIQTRHLRQYLYPSDAELREVGVTGLFLGHYFPWDGYANAQYSKTHGFRTFYKAVEGSIVDYENLDNYQTGIHDYFKYLKYGFGRATDLVCNHIRRGRLSRAEGLQLVRKHDGKFPQTYLDRDIKDILAEIDMTTEEFIAICDQFTNKKLFKLDGHGVLVKDASGNLSKLNGDTPVSA